MLLLLCNYNFFLQDFFSGHTRMWKKPFSGHHALPISMQDIDWTPSLWASMMFLKSWGIPSHHHGCFNTKIVIHDLDDLGVAPFQETAIYVKFPWCNRRWRRSLRVERLHIKLMLTVRTWMKSDRNYRAAAIFPKKRFPDPFGSRLEDIGGALEDKNQYK